LNLLELKQRAGIQDNPDQEGLDLFAELIVKECARVAFATAIGDGTPDEIYDAIKETFRS
jgi:hypothetical protein